MPDQTFIKNVLSYVDPLSVEAGDELRVMVSCTEHDQFDAHLVRLVSGDSRPHGTGFREVELDADLNGRHAGREQPLRPGSWALLPDMPRFDAFTLCCYVYPTALDRPHHNA